MSKAAMTLNLELSECRDVLHKIKALIVATQFLIGSNENQALQKNLLCVCEEEIDEVLEDE